MSLFSGLTPSTAAPPPTNETIGWRPHTLERHTSGLSQHSVHSCKPTLPSKAAPNLKRQLSTGGRTHNGISPGDVPNARMGEVMPPEAQSYASSSSPTRVAFVPQLLRPKGISEAGIKLRQRAPSPYPAAKIFPPATNNKKAIHCEPMIRPYRIRTLTMERMDGVYSVARYLEENPDALPPPGSTPAFVEQYWRRQRRHSGDSVLSNPEADDEASDFGDAESNTSYSAGSSGGGTGCAWDCETAYESDKEYALQPAPRQYTPAATRPPLMRHAHTWAGNTSDHNDSPAQYFTSRELLEPHGGNYPSSTLCGSPHDAPAMRSDPSAARATHYYSPSSWLPTDPSALRTAHELQHHLAWNIPIPSLRWGRDVSADGLWFITSVRPPRGATAGGPEDGGAGPSHTPRAGYCHARDARFGPVDAGKLAKRLGSVAEERLARRASDEGQERVRERRSDGWKGGAGPRATPGAEAEVPPGVAEDFPDYQDAEDAFAEQGDGPVEVGGELASHAHVDSDKHGRHARRRTTSNLPTSKAHRRRAASKLDAAAAPPGSEMHLQSVGEASRPLAIA